MRFVEYAAETRDCQSWRMLSGNEEARLTPGLPRLFLLLTLGVGLLALLTSILGKLLGVV
jgi:hypothetical protein